MSTQNPRLAKLSESGVSIWLDDLSRDRINSGNLAELRDTYSIVGVTTNPSIFSAALTQGTAYDADIAELAQRGATVDEAVFELTTADVAAACDVFADVAAQTDGVDGRVSIEVDPRFAQDAEKTVAQAKELWARVDRPNLLIKIPATKAGLPAITETIAAGISVNVTLIFSVERYREVIEAYLTGLERAAAAGKDLSKIHSVASFFVSRVDTEIDARLTKLGHEGLIGQAGLANARIAYALYEDYFVEGDRFHALAAQGARVQRPLWASTGTKNPEFSDTLYVTGLVGANVVNTVPQATLDAFADHGTVTPNSVLGADLGSKFIATLGDLGIDLDDVFTVLETEGVSKFEAAWTDLLESLQKRLTA